MRLISSTSFFIASTSGLSPISASASLKRVRMVRRSWLTRRASIVVRCSMVRSTRRFISMKADAGLAHLAGAARPEVRDLAALAEALGRVGEPQDRPDLVAQEQDRDGEQHQRRADHPQQEDVRVRRIGRLRRAKTRITASSSWMRDLDEVGAADRVDPERPADLLADLFGQRLVEQREERLRPERRQRVDGQEIDVEPEPLAGRCGAAPRCRGRAGSCFVESISAAMSWVTAADRRRVTVFQCRSMKTKATTDCRITIGAMMMISARA